MDTATWQEYVIGRRRDGSPIFAIAGGDGSEGGEGGAGDGDAGADGGDAGGEGGKSFQAITSQDALDRIIEKRLSRERAKFADYDDLKTKASELDKLQESQKTDLQKATDKLTAEMARATEAEMRAMRLEVAIEKGLSPVQAKRLVGKTKEELEADADELIASFKSDGAGNGTTPPGLPKERMPRGGGDPTADVDETDPRKLAEGIKLY